MVMTNRGASTRRGRRWLALLTLGLAWLGIAAEARAQTTNYLYVPYPVEGGVRRIDTASASDIGVDNVGGNPSCVAIRPDGLGYYVSDTNASTISRVAADGTVVPFVSLPVQCIALSRDQSKLYVTSANALVVLNSVDATEINTIPVGLDPRGLTVSPDGSRIYVSNYVDGTISVIDASTDTVITTIVVGPAPGHVAVSPDGATGLITLMTSDTQHHLNLVTNLVDVTWTTNFQFHSMVFSIDGLYAYGTRTSGEMTLMWSDLSNYVSFGSATLANGPLAVTPDGNDIWTINNGDGSAQRFSIASQSQTAVLASPTPWSLTVADTTGPILGPTVITGALAAIASDAALTTRGFDSAWLPFVNGTLILSGSFTSTRTLSLVSGNNEIDTFGYDATFNGGMVGVTDFTKQGPGRLTLNGAASHNATTIAAGTMEINGAHTNLVTVYSNVAGTGTLGSLDVPSGGMVSPGGVSTTGILSVTSSAAFAGGSTLAIRLNGATAGAGYDRLAQAGVTNLNSPTLSVTLGYTPAAGDTFMIAENVNGAFDGINEGSVVMVGGHRLIASYQGGDGNDFMLTYDGAPALSAFANQTPNAGSGPLTLPFTVSDDFTPIASVIVTATSSNQGFVPNANLAVIGATTSRQLSVTPVPGQDGATTITVSATDGFQITQRTFTVTIVDDAPVLAPIPDQQINVSGSMGPLALNVTDDGTPVAQMAITATSSNSSLLTNNSLVVLGGTPRKLIAMPQTGASGQTTITVTATDQGGRTAQQSFVLTVTSQPPTINGLPDTPSISAGTSYGALLFTVTGGAKDAASVTLTATSSNQTLLPNENIVLGGSGETRKLTATPAFGQSGTATITLTASNGDEEGTASFVLTVLDVPAYFIAEGVTNAFFDTQIAIANPNGTEAPVTITFYNEGGERITWNDTLAPTSRTTLRVKEIEGMENATFSTSVVSTGNLPLAVERSTSWDSSAYGAHAEKANDGVASTWYFAEGSEGYFRTYFLLLNPHAAANVAHVTYYVEGGAPVQREYALLPTSRTTIEIANDAALVNHSFGATITFDRPGIAERAMYFGMNPAFSGGTGATGVTAPSQTWMLAEGATGSFFDTFILIANPNDAPATVETTYLPLSGGPVTTSRVIDPHARVTINVADEHPSLASTAVGTSVSSDVPVTVERSQYWPHGNWHEAHNSAGVPDAGSHWALAEGRVGGASNTQTYILLANAGTQDAEVTATFLRENGTTIVKTVTVPAQSRVNLAVAGTGSDVPELANESFGARLDSTQPITVERSMYWDANGIGWAAGTNATATRLPVH